MRTYPHENEAELKAAGIIRVPRNDPQDAVRCHICDQSTATIESAVEAGWIPSYYEGGEEMEGPVCPDCCTTYLRVGADGEMESFDRFAEVHA